MNKSLVVFSSIVLLVIPTFGISFLLHFIGNILLLIFLVPLLILLITLISFNSLKSKINICNQCGNISFGDSDTCVGCGSDFEDGNSSKFENLNKPSERTIEVKAEEIN